jgi:Na+/H+-dicarboxylate symporter
MSPMPLEPSSSAYLERTRSVVLNVLIAAGVGIAVSSFLLRGREHGTLWRTPEPARRGLLAGLIGLVVTSYAVRRIGAGREALHDPTRRAEWFYRAHVAAACAAALAVPLGLAYGWLFDPRLGAVGPFWVVTLGMGSLALPRSHELEGFDRSLREPEPNEPNA